MKTTGNQDIWVLGGDEGMIIRRADAADIRRARNARNGAWGESGAWDESEERYLGVLVFADATETELVGTVGIGINEIASEKI